MKKDIVYLHHVVESIELIEEYMADRSKDEFLTSFKLQDAII